MPAEVSPPSPKTGFSNSQCYASELNDCDSKLSREHYITKALLEYLNIDKELKIEGLSWTAGKEQSIPPNALASKILCQRHNSTLSVLDENALRLFKAFDEENAKGSGIKTLYLFSGNDIERWLIKVFCGLLYSKLIKYDQDISEDCLRNLINVLLGGDEFKGNCGLYICRELGHFHKGPRGFEVRLIGNHTNITGIGFFICGYEFVLSITDRDFRIFDKRKFIHRPMELYTTAENYEKAVVFCWQGKADLGTIQYRIP